MIRWEQGRGEVQQLLDQGRLTPVHPSWELATEHVETAKRRLNAAEAVRDIDASGGFVLAYDAARLAIAAVLVNQGSPSTR